ncbi:MAG: hypothetical protein A2293_14015 [Elusimicrobia bacterium RIFOXYB2_FULL_49_7]|nr:MAG: hypothetical protein A2293_14015 [Elusimicrobia bacterium RIFOXYB2_FULL_49_7]
MKETRHLATLHTCFLKGQKRTLPELCQLLDLSRASVMRRLNRLRDCSLPLICCPSTHRYHYAGPVDPGVDFPGLFFTPSETAALLSLSALIEQLNPGLFRSTLEQSRRKILALNPVVPSVLKELSERVRLAPIHHRCIAAEILPVIAHALLHRKRLQFDYPASHAPDSALCCRTVSPQTLLFYRNNWYLDGYCHFRNELRTFGISRIRTCTLLKTNAKNIRRAELIRYFQAGYGIFAGGKVDTVRLRFSGMGACYAAEEEWHPDQTRILMKDGTVELSFPASDHRELTRDILSYGSEIEVLAPNDLRGHIAGIYTKAAQQYAGKGVK